MNDNHTPPEEVVDLARLKAAYAEKKQKDLSAQLNARLEGLYGNAPAAVLETEIKPLIEVIKRAMVRGYNELHMTSKYLEKGDLDAAMSSMFNAEDAVHMTQTHFMSLNMYMSYVPPGDDGDDQ